MFKIMKTTLVTILILLIVAAVTATVSKAWEV